MTKIQDAKNGSHTIVIPVDIMRVKGWKKGVMLYFEYNSKTGEVNLLDLHTGLTKGRKK